MKKLRSREIMIFVSHHMVAIAKLNLESESLALRLPYQIFNPPRELSFSFILK